MLGVLRGVVDRVRVGMCGGGNRWRVRVGIEHVGRRGRGTCVCVAAGREKCFSSTLTSIAQSLLSLLPGGGGGR